MGRGRGHGHGRLGFTCSEHLLVSLFSFSLFFSFFFEGWGFCLRGEREREREGRWGGVVGWDGSDSIYLHSVGVSGRAIGDWPWRNKLEYFTSFFSLFFSFFFFFEKL